MSEHQGESIRAWFERKTGKIRKAIFWFGIFAVIGSIIAFMAMPERWIATLQVFNGAMTIPVFGGLWMIAFIFMFLLPSREAGFRSQEGIDEAKVMLAKAIDEKVGPAMDKLQKVAAKVEEYLEGGIVDNVQGAVDSVQAAVLEVRTSFKERMVPAADCLNRVCQRIEGSIVNSKLLDEMRDASVAFGALCRKYEKAGVPDGAQVLQFMAEAKPVLAMLKNVQVKFEKDFNADFVSDLKDAVSSVRELGGMAPRAKKGPSAAVPAPQAPVQAQRPVPAKISVQVMPVKPKSDSREPDLDRALAAIRGKKLEKVV